VTTELAKDLAASLDSETFLKVYWPDDPDAPEPGTPGVIFLQWPESLIIKVGDDRDSE